jgi:hypothetical protein
MMIISTQSSDNQIQTIPNIFNIFCKKKKKNSEILKSREILIFFGRTEEGLKSGRFSLLHGRITGMPFFAERITGMPFFAERITGMPFFADPATRNAHQKEDSNDTTFDKQEIDLGGGGHNLLMHIVKALIGFALKRIKHHFINYSSSHCQSI